jgi:excisionase family DNA binding protein
MVEGFAPGGDAALTTGEAARLLGTSRQHVVDLCTRGALPFESVGRHRRVRRSDVLAFRRHPTTSGLTRDQMRSLWLHRAVAGKLLANPRRGLTIARRNLRKLQQAHPRGQAARVLAEWETLLDGPIEAVADALTSKTQPAVELRQSSPFAGLLSERERTAVLSAFRQQSIFP